MAPLALWTLLAWVGLCRAFHLDRAGRVGRAPFALRPLCASTTDTNNDALAKTCATMFAISAPLGTSLDNYHGLFGVLSYENNGLPLTYQLEWAGQVVLKSALWVPAVFGGAGVVMSLMVVLLDQAWSTEQIKRLPSWPKTLYSISFFSFQYYLSGLLDNLHVESALIHAALAGIALIGYKVFDDSKAGLVLAIATAAAGPVAEILLINWPHLYHYTHADIWGICSWIPWVYFLGAPAVGNLARNVYDGYSLQAQMQEASERTSE
ncbi:hypothetical protein B484DRAFT_429649 [Ochromonadaceae sp. CCMP2298]|nr:hypothetical protein B484DRAFT_429649 [Ochromonadaceae sp. CCMP2298]